MSVSGAIKTANPRLFDSPWEKNILPPTALARQSLILGKNDFIE